jgi:hypothetical protein
VGSTEPDPAGARPAGRGLLATFVALVQQARADGELAVRYIQCDGCGSPTPHHAEVQIFSATPRDPVFVAAPPEVVCALCTSVHPRVVGDEPAPDTQIICRARRRPGARLDRLPSFGDRPSSRLPLGRLRLAGRSARDQLSRALSGECGHHFAVPAATEVILCPRCATVQPGPALGVSGPGSRS